MRIALIQQSIVPGDKQANYARAGTLVKKAAEQPGGRPDIIVLPELWSTGYALADLDSLASSNGEEEAEFLSELARRYGIWFAGGSVAAKTPRGITNRAQVIDRGGSLVATYDKVHLVPMLDEDKYLVAGDRRCLHTIEGVTFGLTICYDLRFGELLRKLTLEGAQALIISAEWPLARLSHWQALLKARAVENQCYVIAVNNCAMGDVPFAGHTQMLGPDGRKLCQLEFQEEIAMADIDPEAVNRIREAVPVFRDRRPELY
ncbi:MAG: carbon-nitrogen family hydrolase [Desulfofustis sp.]|nr:carbon-nitrogen family hydrolase [Desulfofustis sp.]